MSTFHFEEKSGKKGMAVEHVAYIAREGKHKGRGDLVAAGFGNMPEWSANDPRRFWQTADKHERANAAVFRELIIALPSELELPEQRRLVQELTKALAGRKPFVGAVHSPISSLSGERNPHLHLIYTDRVPDGIAREPENVFRRHNAKQPEKGGWRKDSGGLTSVELSQRLSAKRKLVAAIINNALEKAGSPERVDPRPLRQRGVQRPAEQHLGQARIRRMSAEEKKDLVAARQSHHPSERPAKLAGA